MDKKPIEASNEPEVIVENYEKPTPKPKKGNIITWYKGLDQNKKLYVLTGGVLVFALLSLFVVSMIMNASTAEKKEEPKKEAKVTPTEEPTETPEPTEPKKTNTFIPAVKKAATPIPTAVPTKQPDPTAVPTVAPTSVTPTQITPTAGTAENTPTPTP